jgi:hypothetical protein
VQELLALGLQIATNHGLGRAPLLLADKVSGSRSSGAARGIAISIDALRHDK